MDSDKMYLVKEGRKKRKSHGPASAKPTPGRRLSIFNVSSATRECRICFMGDEKEGAPDGKRGDDELIAPCRCDGSMKWVHRGCLAGWNKRAPSKKHCPVCKFRYVMKLHLKPASEWPKRPPPLRQFRKTMLRWEVEDASTPQSDDDSKEREEDAE